MFDERRRRRRVATAIGGAALAVVATTAVVARGPEIGSPYETLIPNFSHGWSGGWSGGSRSPSPARPNHLHSAAVTGRPVCVRLCDGAFFPISTGAREVSNEAICQNLCPDTETAVYLEPRGSDDVADSVSTTGRPYSELPTALSYRMALDKTCVCHRDLAPHYSLAEDSTLRRGDIVMTLDGAVVFEGGPTLPHRAGDFVALAKTRLPAGRRLALEALQGPHSAPRGSVRVTTP